MLILIVAGLVYTITQDSTPVAIITAGLIVYRAQRPSTLRHRLRDAWIARQADMVGDE